LSPYSGITAPILQRARATPMSGFLHRSRAFMQHSRWSARRCGVAILRARGIRDAALRLSGAADRAVVLVYHRVAPAGAAAHEVVPSLPISLFAHQLETLAEIGEIVPLRALLEPARRPGRPRFAITFDDDHPSHRRWTLPVLQRMRVHATFFLSGRALGHAGPYWWSAIEHSIRVQGLAKTGRLLGLHARTPPELGAAVTASGKAALVSQLLPTFDEPPMAVADMRALAEAGMGIGFHTRRHPVMTSLPPMALETALIEGRHDLEVATGMPLEFLAYPHGLADTRVAAAAARAGFRAAFTTDQRSISARSYRFLLGRWDPAFLHGSELTAAAAFRLMRPPTPPLEASEDERPGTPGGAEQCA
jgi:peptidoglycan/xylan/chitin deacetylase (PgdA/CDA1 family)